MLLAGRPDGLEGKKMRTTHHIVVGRRSSVKVGATAWVVFTAVVPTVRTSRDRYIGRSLA